MSVCVACQSMLILLFACWVVLHNYLSPFEFFKLSFLFFLIKFVETSFLPWSTSGVGARCVLSDMF